MKEGRESILDFRSVDFVLFRILAQTPELNRELPHKLRKKK